MPSPRLCLVCGLSEDEVQSMHRFPTNLARSKVWQENMGIVYTGDSRAGSMICCRHFSEENYLSQAKDRLRRNAVPTLFPSVPSTSDGTHSTAGQTVAHILHSVSDITAEVDAPQMAAPAMDSSTPNTSKGITDIAMQTNAPQMAVPTMDSSTTNTSTRSTRKLFRGMKDISRATATPRKLKLMDVICRKEDHVRKLKNMCKKKSNDLKALCALDESEVARKLFKDMPMSTVNFLVSQLRNARREPRGRRWSIEEKVVALALMKRSPKCFRFLSKIVAMPSHRTLTNLLRGVSFQPGINDHIFKHIDHCVQKNEDRLCSLLFDEIDIKESLYYDICSDQIIGFEDLGDNCGTQFANKVLVFMLQGLHKTWKQPIAYYFSHNGCKAEELIICLKQVLTAAINTSNLDVVTTICDMGSSNVKALKMLNSTIQEPFFVHEDHRIFTMFDPPHLLKCIVALFRKHNVSLPVTVGDRTEIMVAKFDDVRAAYEIDSESPLIFRAMPKLKDHHMAPIMRFTMKVNIAAQTMSRSVGAFLYTLLSRGEIEQRSIATATFITQVDELFDSFNGSQKTAPDGKPLKTSISCTSEHSGYWKKAFNMVKSWRFLRKNKKGHVLTSNPPSQYGWMLSLRAIQHIWQYVNSKGMEFLRGRVLNQDPLENLFSSVRSGCGSADNPTPMQFIGSLKTQVLNSLANQGLQNSNCEEDDSHLLSNLQTFLTVDGDSKHSEYDDLGVAPILSHDTRVDVVACDVAAAVALGTTATLSVAYVSGFIAKRIVKEVAGCQSCVSCLCSSSLDPHNLFIVNKEWSDDDAKLTYPSESLVAAVGEAVTLLEKFLLHHKGRPHVLRTAVQHMKEQIDFSWVSCTNHMESIIGSTLKGVGRIGIPWWCNRQNQQRLRERKDTRAEKSKIKKMAHN